MTTEYACDGFSRPRQRTALLVALVVSGLCVEAAAQQIKAPAVQRAPGPSTRPRAVSAISPDLRVVSFDAATTTAVVRNASPIEAKFSKAALLVAGSQEYVPAGGVLAPSAQKSVRLTGVRWDCDNAVNEVTLGHYSNWPATYLPKPTDTAGRELVFVDPQGAVAESDEANNASIALVRPNPLYSPGKLPDLIMTATRAWLDGDYLRFEWTIRNTGAAAASACATYQPTDGSPGYVGTQVYRVEIDGKPTALNSTFLTSPWVLRPAEEKKAWEHIALQKVSYGVPDNGLAPGCHEIKFIVDQPAQIKESNECNNASVVYAATGGAMCGADKKAHNPSTCPLSIAPVRAVAPLRTTPKPVAP